VSTEDDKIDVIKVTYAEGMEAPRFCENITMGYSNEVFMLEMVQGINEEEVLVHGRYVITPAHAARLAAFLMEKVQEFEAQYGPIPQYPLPVQPTGTGTGSSKN